MPYMATNPEAQRDKTIGYGQCVAFVQLVSHAPQTSAWKRGKRVKGDVTISTGTAIATFDAAGKYTNSLDGSSHAAIYVKQDAKGILVWDQWVGQPVHQRWIRFQGGPPAKPVNDGDAYYVIA